LVVGRDGKAYKKEDWNKSNTFWQDNQENLLISDNQTNKYSRAYSKERMALSLLAWGDTNKALQLENDLHQKAVN
jgi:hypothetical protein